MLLTLSSVDQPVVQVQFSTVFDRRCEIALTYQPVGQASIFLQVWDMLKRQPSIAPAEAAAAISLIREVRGIPCEGELAELIRSAEGLTVPLTNPEKGRRILHLDGRYYSLELVTPSLKVRSEFPSSLDMPLVAWVNRVRAEVISILTDVPTP